MNRLAQHAFPTLVTPRPASGSPRPAGEAHDPLASYFRDLAQHEVMSRDEELAAAIEIWTARQEHWRSLLGYLPLAAAVCALIREVLPAEDVPLAAVEALEAAAHDLRSRELACHLRAFEAAREALALAMAEVDVDAVVSERVLGDLGRLAAGQHEGVTMKAKLPRKDSLPFVTHVAAVRATHAALWTARHRFIRANLRLVITVARRFNHGKLALHDLIQEGNIGLMKAVDRFDHRRGFRFSTYASWWIRHSISRALADTGRAVRLPVHMIDAQARVARVRREFEATHGREPGDVELAQATELSLERIQRMRWSLVETPLSLDAPIGEEAGRTLQDVLEDPSGAAIPDQLDSELLHARLQEALAMLPPMEAAVLRQRMGLGDEPEQTLREIGERHALSRERIRQIQAQAIGRLRREFKRHALM